MHGREGLVHKPQISVHTPCAQLRKMCDIRCSQFPGEAPRLRVHASSVLARTRPQHLLFWQVQQSSSGWYEMQDVTAIEADWLPEAAPHVFRKTGARA